MCTFKGVWLYDAHLRHKNSCFTEKLKEQTQRQVTTATHWLSDVTMETADTAL